MATPSTTAETLTRKAERLVVGEGKRKRAQVARKPMATKLSQAQKDEKTAKLHAAYNEMLLEKNTSISKPVGKSGARVGVVAGRQNMFQRILKRL